MYTHLQMHTAVFAFFGLISTATAQWPVAEAQNRRCLNCHGQRQITTLPQEERDAMVSTRASSPRKSLEGLYFDEAVFQRSSHSKVGCLDCHPDAANLPHAAKLPEPKCDACHHVQADLYLRSSHAEKLAEEQSESPRCWTCHGTHDILPSSNSEANTYPLKVVAICTTCHQKHGMAPDVQQTGRQLIDSYMGSAHGKAVKEAGLVVAATCPDCHRAHDVLPSSNQNSSVHRNRVPQTCGHCHAGILETYGQSIHGQRLSEGHKQAPVCTDCHTAHSITRASTPSFSRDIIAECGECHDRPEVSAGRRASFYETYRRSYHGQAHGLGSSRAARCSDCHGAHDIRPIEDPMSRLSGDKRINVCRSCHEGANPRFAEFQAHADYRDGKRYPAVHAVWLYFVVVMSGAFGFFGLHSLLWFGRSVIERVRKGPSPKFVANSHAIMRFTRSDRINHAFAIISFFGLTFTGAPLLFSDHQWARKLAMIMGGGNSAGILHRVFAIMLLCNFAMHIVVLIKRRQRHKTWGEWLFGPNTMLPRLKDAQDCLGMFRWFFCGGHKPAFDRWTYWEKFDYSAEVFGSLIIGGSGLLLWFPVFFSSFVPGWIYNMAMIVHGYEALLAMCFIFTIHFFNAHLRLEKFPVDDVIFTGRLSEEEFKHERAVEYERLVERNQLDTLKVPPAPAWQRKMAILVGLFAMLIGMSLVIMIILGSLNMLEE